MILFPAIDLKNGKAVRLYRGEFATAHQVADDPLAIARAFYAAGARHIHMVDLDGARSGTGENGAIVEAVARSSGLKVELGGGIRSMADLAVRHRLRSRQLPGVCPGGGGPIRSACRRRHRRDGRRRQDLRVGAVLGARLSKLCKARGINGCKDDYLYGYCH